MKEALLEKNKQITVVPKDFTKSFRTEILDVQENNIIISNNGNTSYSSDEVDFYTTSEKGSLFFREKIVSFEKEFLVIPIPKNIDILERRTSKRRKCYIEGFLYTENNTEIPVEIINLSTTGFCLLCKQELSNFQEYILNFNTEPSSIIKSNIKIIDKIKKDSVYYVRGVFNNLTNEYFSKISQYCEVK